MDKPSRWYRVGQAVGLWRVAVEDRGVVSGTGLWLLAGAVAVIGRQAAHDVKQVAEAES